MKKRTFLQAVLATGGIALVSTRRQEGSIATSLRNPGAAPPPATVPGLPIASPQEEFQLVLLQESELHPAFSHQEREPPPAPAPPQQVDTARLEQAVERLPDQTIDSYLEKIRNFDADFRSDVYLSEAHAMLLLPTLQRLERVQNFVGHANFNLLGFDEMLYFARNYDAIGAFEKPELAFLEEIFHADATRYGFFGDKVTPELTHRISQKDVEKIAGSGHYLLKGESLNHFRQIRNDVGSDLLLTSGLRNNVKQMHLFLAKALQSDGNLSKASRSLAPPGHSYHNVGDFDVGKTGLGELNFTADFSHTDEFHRLISLGYVDIRYTDTNQFGVRYEPWHIKLACPDHGHTCT